MSIISSYLKTQKKLYIRKNKIAKSESQELNMQQTKVQIDIMKVNNEIDNNHKTQSPSETYGEGAAPVFVARVQTRFLTFNIEGFQGQQLRQIATAI